MTDILMPKLSDTMEEGKIIRWLKQRGDRVAIGDILAEVETDKANMELEAFDEGVLGEIRTVEGESAPVGAVIAVLVEPGTAVEGKEPAAAGKPDAAAARAADTPAPAAAARPADERRAEAKAPPNEERDREGDEAAAAEADGESEPPVAPAASRSPRSESAPPPASPEASRGDAPGSPTGAGDRVRASPLARRIARERAVDLGTLRGSGPGGRIVERDVEAAAKQPAAAEPAPRPRAVAAVAKPAAGERAGTRVELGKVRRTTAKRMAEAKRDIPHFYASSDVTMDECVRLKDGLAALEGEYTGVTYTHLVLKAVGIALRRVPELNATFDDGTVLLHETVHVGLATATDDGLVVPVVRDVDRQPLGALIAQTRALVERARAGKFAADDLRGATFTVSNLGMYPVAHFAAVVNPPQAAILAVGAVREVAVVRSDAVVPGRLMTVTLSCDHRVVDGVLAGRFLKELNTLLGSPLALVA
jgi:pyruvate dehydrogenase E2 component (dihydrolipoamide acetyltransferase)